MSTDYYKILGVSKQATDAEIKKQYRKLARKYHPDVSKLKNAEKRFKEVNEAYDVLKNKEKRRQYDMFGQAGPGAGGFNQGGAGFNPGGNFNTGASGADFGGFGGGSFSDIFENMFTGGGSRQSGFNEQQSQRSQRSQRQQSQSQPSSQTLDINVQLEDVFLGAEKIFNLSIPGEKDSKRIKVKIPKGIAEGKKIRLPQQGQRNTDILLKINYAKHNIFTVDNNDILLNLPLTVWEAALGATIAVPTLGGKVDLKIPPDSQSGRKLRLKGRGLGSPAGDLYVTLMIKIPPESNNDLVKIYSQLKNASSYNPREHFK